jgi:hypothetical protein
MAKKLTKKQQAAIDAANEAQLDAFDAFRAKHHGVEQDAVLAWIDALSGEGMVSLSDGTQLMAHFSAIDGIDKNNYTWPTDADRERLAALGYNTPIRVVPYISYGGCMCEKITLIKG